MSTSTDMMVTRAEPNIGARIDGVDLSGGGTADTVAKLRAALLEHHVIAISGQDLPATELEAFARQWGDLLTHPATQHRDTPFIQFIPGSGTRDKDFGSWHSDMTWHPTPPIVSMLHARRLPETGGDTAFANQHLAYETLPSHLRTALDQATAYNSGKVFGPDVPDTVHPAVRTHDETGREALYVNAVFTTHFMDMDPTASKALLLETLLHATRVEFVYRHKWELHDLVIWDNRSVMHCPSRDYEGKRYMNRAVVAGGAPVR